MKHIGALICYMAFTLVLFMQSCNSSNHQKEPFKSLLNACTKVDIVFYNKGDTLHFKTTDSSGVKLLQQMVTGYNESLVDTCAAIGSLNYFNQSGPTLMVQFAVKKMANKITCNYITYTYNGNAYKHKLSEKGRDLLLQLGPK